MLGEICQHFSICFEHQLPGFQAYKLPVRSVSLFHAGDIKYLAIFHESNPDVQLLAEFGGHQIDQRPMWPALFNGQNQCVWILAPATCLFFHQPGKLRENSKHSLFPAQQSWGIKCRSERCPSQGRKQQVRMSISHHGQLWSKVHLTETRVALMSI